MKCFYHNDRDATAQCSECGKLLCSECAEEWTPALCPDCGKAASKKIKSRARGVIAAAVILGAIGFLTAFCSLGDKSLFDVNFFQRLGYSLLSGYCFAGLIFGWLALNRLTADMFLFLSVVGWLIYFLIKLFLSFFVGLFALPYYVIKEIRQIRRV